MFYFIPWPHLSLPPCFNPSTWRLILLNSQNMSREGHNMINYRLLAAVSVYYIMQTLVKNTHLFCWCHFSHVPPVSFHSIPTFYYNSASLTTFYFFSLRTSFSRLKEYKKNPQSYNLVQPEKYRVTFCCSGLKMFVHKLICDLRKLFDSLSCSLIILSGKEVCVWTDAQRSGCQI